MFDFQSGDYLINKNNKSKRGTSFKKQDKMDSFITPKKNRDAEGVFIVEGEKMVREIIENTPDAVTLLCSTDPDFQTSIPCFHSDTATLKTISTLKTPNQLLAVVKKPTPSPIEGSEMILMLDGIQDPGNLGTIIRTADWFGVREIICSKETVDCFNPKVIQSSMGSLFRIPIRYTLLSDVLAQTELPVYGALLDGKNMYEQSLNKKGIIVIGNEGKGISDALRPFISHPLFIPRYGEAESLNASIATAVILATFQQ